MTEMSLGGHGTPNPDDIDAACAELRERITNIGTAIAQLRGEAERLMASADARYPAIALLERPDMVLAQRLSAAPSIEVVAGSPDLTPNEAPRAGQGSRIVAPVPPWRGEEADVASTVGPAEDPPASDAAQHSHGARTDGGSADLSDSQPGEQPAPPEPAALAGSDLSEQAAHDLGVEPDPSAGVGERGLTDDLPEGEGTFDWDPLGEEAEAAFERFFSADMEPEPSQRWLLS